MNKDTRSEQARKLAAGNFKENNGSVLRTINILRHEFNRLKSIKYALEDISEAEILDSINFLHEERYIHLRQSTTKEPASLADNDYEQLEAKLTGKGIRLLAGGISDNMIDL